MVVVIVLLLSFACQSCLPLSYPILCFAAASRRLWCVVAGGVVNALAD